jgi:hypothetical protein
MPVPNNAMMMRHLDTPTAEVVAAAPTVQNVRVTLPPQHAMYDGSLISSLPVGDLLL